MIRPARLTFIPIVLWITLSISAGQTAAGRTRHAAAMAAPAICADCIRAHMDFLASDALRGRGSATNDELIAASYVASELMQYGIEPLGDNGGFLQRVPLVRRSFTIPPQLRFFSGGEDLTWKHGLDFLALHVGQDNLAAPLQKIRAGTDAEVQKGAFVFLMAGSDGNRPDQGAARNAIEAGAAAVIIPASQFERKHWQQTGEDLYSGRLELANASGTGAEDKTTILALGDDAVKQMSAVADGTVIRLISPMDKPKPAATWNVLGELKARTGGLEDSAVLLSAHLDHLGVGVPVNGDDIYNGADDDASGTTAVLEFARVLSRGQRPRRPLIFALFGSEELGDLGAEYLLEHPPIPLENIAVNLNFEMIGRPDPGIGADELWVTGWSRSDLGPELAAHGAKLVADPHPDQHFFSRSDNYPLAQMGVVAHTISSFGLHPDYHQPSDELSRIDFKHMDSAIASLIKPLLWLVDGTFTPEWSNGGQP